MRSQRSVSGDLGSLGAMQKGSAREHFRSARGHFDSALVPRGRFRVPRGPAARDGAGGGTFYPVERADGPAEQRSVGRSEALMPFIPNGASESLGLNLRSKLAALLAHRSSALPEGRSSI